jgi:hypothetical protein
VPDGVEQVSYLPEEVFDFEIERTDAPLIARAGLVLPYQMAKALGLPRVVDRELPEPGSERGYHPSAFVMPIILMLHGGGQALEDLRELRSEVTLRKLLKMAEMPASCTVGDWLRRMGADGRGLAGLERVNDHLTGHVLKGGGSEGYVLDTDATIIETEQRAAQWTYQNTKGYQPLLGFLHSENRQAQDTGGLIVADEFLEGNEQAGSKAIAFLQRCAKKVPAGKKLKAVRADSAWYQAKVFNWCDDSQVRLVVGGDLDAAVREAIYRIDSAEWEPYKGNREIAETVHCMQDTVKAFRLVVLRWPKGQPDMFDPHPFNYHVIATNGEEDKREVVAFYNQRGEIENWIKDLKSGFGVEWMPCGESYANAVYFRLGVIAYNLFVAMKALSLPGRWQRYTIETIRWRLYQIAGEVFWESRRVVLRLVTSLEKLKLLLQARAIIQRLAID